MTKTTLVWPCPVLGPVSTKRLGKPWTVVPLYADMPLVGPLVGEGAARASDDALGDRQLGRPEAGGDDDHVDRVLDAVRR